jgi:rhodanese-related sulfurtransferase
LESVSGIDRLLASSRARLTRVEPDEGARLVADGALLIDIRPAAQRAQFGEVPGAIVIERNVLEWRLCPDGPDRLAEAEDPQRPVVVMCQDGYASSLAAAALLDAGRTIATDLAGGFTAWKAAGLPTTPPTVGADPR